MCSHALQRVSGIWGADFMRHGWAGLSSNSGLSSPVNWSDGGFNDSRFHGRRRRGVAPQPWPNGCAAGRKRLGQGYAPRRGSRQRRPVRGSFSTGVWSHELAHLYLALHELWRGFGAARAVDFALREQTLALSIALAHSGHVALTFDARDDPAGETALHGALTAEHAALARWLVSLYRVLQRFPPQLPTPRLPPPPPADGERG